jgi:hypothetical protein
VLHQSLVYFGSLRTTAYEFPVVSDPFVKFDPVTAAVLCCAFQVSVYIRQQPCDLR